MGIVGSSEKTPVSFCICFVLYVVVIVIIRTMDLWKSPIMNVEIDILSIGSMENHHEKLRYKLRKRLWFSFKTRESAQ